MKTLKCKKKKIILNRILLLLAAAAVLSFITEVFIAEDKTIGAEVVVQVGGYPITEPEYDFFLKQTKSDVRRYFKSTYGVDLGDGGWERLYGGEKPKEVWETVARKEAVRFKTEQVLALEKGIVADISYDYFLESLQSENERRRKVTAEGGILYGLLQYTEKTYYDYLQSNLRIQLKSSLADAELKLDESTLAEEYEKMKDPVFHEGYEIVAEVAYHAEGDLRSEVVSLNCMDQSSEDSERHWLYQNMAVLEPGETIRVSGKNGEDIAVCCKDKKDMGYQDFESAKIVIQKQYVEEHYEAFIAERAKEMIDEGV